MLRNEFIKCTTLEELKKVYKKLALANHPDRGGNVETMKEVNALYDEYFAKLKDIHKNKDGETYTKENKETPDIFKDIIDQLIRMNGVEIEIIGCFIWIGGNTKPYKDEIKKMGFKWHSNKKLWYKAPADYRKKSKKKYEMEEIREMYGTTGTFTGKADENTMLQGA